MKFQYLALKAELKWDGAEFHIDVDYYGTPTDLSTMGSNGWEVIGFFPDAHAIGDIDKGYKDGRDGWVPPNQRVIILKQARP